MKLSRVSVSRIWRRIWRKFFIQLLLLSAEYSPVLALGVVLQLALDHVDHDLVADETTLIHDLLSLLAEVGLLRDLGPQHVTGGLLRSHWLDGSWYRALPERIIEYLPGGTRSTCP